MTAIAQVRRIQRTLARHPATVWANAGAFRNPQPHADGVVQERWALRWLNIYRQHGGEL